VAGRWLILSSLARWSAAPRSESSRTCTTSPTASETCSSRWPKGRTNAAIAEQLALSESSIEKYATSILAKLGLRDERQTHRRVAAVLALRRDAGRAQPL
jgi:DNA-binding CsgD family transcriptional regulator